MQQRLGGVARIRLPGDDKYIPDAELAEVITGRLLPTLDALPTVDAMLDRWQDELSIDEGARQQPQYITRL